ncbi:MAG: hypothetical protein B6229_08820 [Spirochaetaceae bacterium 4572_7]|nr:MAG: hypothetical protein B6229_08820 [Spirochaetaceae bacterium 4572_7]
MQVIKIISINQFLEEEQDLPIVDVRTPSEFAKGHVTGAVNIPLFSDIERADVGTCYKKIGKDDAVEMGLDIVGPKLGDFVRECKKLAPNGEIKLYCYRGGMRSGSFAWLLDTAGFKKIYRLEKGYKAFRNHVLDFFESMKT